MQEQKLKEMEGAMLRGDPLARQCRLIQCQLDLRRLLTRVFGPGERAQEILPVSRQIDGGDCLIIGAVQHDFGYNICLNHRHFLKLSNP